jgi:hypothetical protein
MLTVDVQYSNSLKLLVVVAVVGLGMTIEGEVGARNYWVKVVGGFSGTGASLVCLLSI